MHPPAMCSEASAAGLKYRARYDSGQHGANWTKSCFNTRQVQLRLRCYCAGHGWPDTRCYTYAAHTKYVVSDNMYNHTPTHPSMNNGSLFGALVSPDMVQKTSEMYYT